MERRDPAKQPGLLRIPSHFAGFVTKDTFAKMRLPHPLIDSQFFLFATADEFRKAMGDSMSPTELDEVNRIIASRLPPVTSRTALATMFGINPGLIWSFENRTFRHYRSFTIPKGKNGGVRMIHAPRVALKIIQKWLAVHLERVFVPAPHVFGFVSGRSHIDAAAQHCNAHWVFSVDVLDFFATTPKTLVEESLRQIGFGADGVEILSRLACFREALAQGAPSSPVLSNMCFNVWDAELSEIAKKYAVRLTRYADDIVFSGEGECPGGLIQDVQDVFTQSPWQLAPQKTSLAVLPNRLKVHGLLVHGDKVRLTKGYRNKLRTYRHLVEKGAVDPRDLPRILGHLQYDSFVSSR